jgi:hypothetical protein
MERFGEFFDDIIKLLEGAERQYGVANLQYTEFIIERLEFCIISCNTILDQLSLSQSSTTGMDEYCVYLKELVDCLRQIYYKWEEYELILHSHQGALLLSYQSPLLRSSGGRGRPRFEITKDQLLYLASLSFKWTDIAALLCVSRMTIFRLVTGIQ